MLQDTLLARLECLYLCLQVADFFQHFLTQVRSGVELSLCIHQGAAKELAIAVDWACGPAAVYST